MKKIVLSLMLAAVGSCAWAEWVKMAEKKEGEAVGRLFVDSATVRSSGNLRRVMTLMNFGFNGVMAPIAAVSLNEFDCWENRGRTLSTTMHEGSMGQGKRIELPANEAAELEKLFGVWGNISSERGDDAVLKYVCSR